MVANWNNPTTTRSYSDHESDLKERDLSAIKQDPSGDSNIPTGAIWLDQTAKKWKEWNGSSWVDPFSGAYAIDVDTVDGQHASEFAASSHVGATGAAHGAATTSVNGFMTAAMVTQLNGLGTLSTVNSPCPVANGGTGSTTAAGARTNLGLGSAAEKNVGVSNGQVPQMDATGYPAANGSQLTNLPSAAGFGAAAQLGVAAGGSGSLLRNDGVGSSLTAIKGRILRVQLFESNGTFTTGANATALLVFAQAAGGSGGAGNGGNGGGGGGAGEYKEAFITSPAASYSVVIGIGGVGGSGNGAAGGDTTFGSSVVTCDGGDGGTQGSSGGDGGAGGNQGVTEDEYLASIGGSGEDRHGSNGGVGGSPAGLGFGGKRRRSNTAESGLRGGGGGGGDAGHNGGGGGKGYCLVIEYGDTNHA